MQTNITGFPTNKIRIGTYHTEDIKNLIKSARSKYLGKVFFEGVLVNVSSLRTWHYLELKLECKHCGLRGKYFALEKDLDKPDNEVYHFSLYGIKNNKEILLDKDHITPKMHGGTSRHENIQLLCRKCNTKKGNKVKI